MADTVTEPGALEALDKEIAALRGVLGGLRELGPPADDSLRVVLRAIVSREKQRIDVLAGIW